MPASQGDYLFGLVAFAFTCKIKDKNHDSSNDPQGCFHWGIAPGEASRSAFGGLGGPLKAKDRSGSECGREEKSRSNLLWGIIGLLRQRNWEPRPVGIPAPEKAIETGQLRVL